jgi:hypothetical protein
MLNTLLSIVATDTCDKSGDFFGLHPWYHYLPSTDFQGCDLSNFNFLPSSTQASDVPLVALAVIDDLLRIAGIVAIAFVVVGSVRYITSQGNPEQTAQAQSTIINALIGTAIAIAAATFVGFVGSQLGG